MKGDLVVPAWTAVTTGQVKIFLSEMDLNV